MLISVIRYADVVIQLAGQMAVTTSVADPQVYFDNNLIGSFNLLEAIRKCKTNPTVIFSSTNKVYGAMEEIEVIAKDNRYEYLDYPMGISEDFQLDFHSLYGCSKGAAD